MLITEKDVGRKVLHRDGAVSAITGWDDEDPRWTSHIETYFYKDGRFIIAFADEKERTMKHVIAGEAQEDVLEWQLMIDDGWVYMQARKPGEGWKSVAIVSHSGLISTDLTGNHQDLGLKLAK